MAASLQNKVVIITGASGGIGEATALYFAGLKVRLVLTSRRMSVLQEVKAKCLERGLTENMVLLVAADLSKDEDIERVVKETVDTFGGIDVLVNNAAVFVGLNTIDTPMADYDDVMRTNIRAPFYLSKLCIPYLIKSKGNIVNISSISGQCSYLFEAAYGVSKAALDQFTKILAIELAGNKVRVNSVNPGGVRTGIEKKSGMSDVEYEKFCELECTRHPLGGVVEAVQVAKAIAFLASDDADFTTGQILFVDGGRNMVAI